MDAHDEMIAANKGDMPTYEELESQLSEANALIAMQAEALKKIVVEGDYTAPEGMKRIAKQALSASPESLAAWEAKKLEPLRAQVAMLHKDATRWKKVVALASHSSESMEAGSHQQGRGLLVMYEGSGVRSWLVNLQDETLINFIDNQRIAVEDNPQATADQFIAECEQRGAEQFKQLLLEASKVIVHPHIEGVFAVYQSRATSKKAG